MYDVWADRIQELGVIVVALIGLATAWQGRQLRQLKAKVSELEEAVTHTEKKFRAGIRHIRAWMAWERQPEPRGPIPGVPEELIDDI